MDQNAEGRVHAELSQQSLAVQTLLPLDFEPCPMVNQQHALIINDGLNKPPAVDTVASTEAVDTIIPKHIDVEIQKQGKELHELLQMFK
jgi:hypothetical protein